MAEPWQCPECRDWMAPTVTSHHCAEKPAEKRAEAKQEESAQPPGYSGHNGGSFERVSSVRYEPAPRWGFRP